MTNDTVFYIPTAVHVVTWDGTSLFTQTTQQTYVSRKEFEKFKHQENVDCFALTLFIVVIATIVSLNNKYK